MVQFIDSFEGGMRKTGTPGRSYNYLYTGSRDVSVGDYAVVHNGINFGVVEIQRVKPGIDDKVTKHVITVITKEDMQHYHDANASISKHRQVFDQLDYMLEQDKKIDKYRELATRNPEAADLLKQAGIWQGPVIESQKAPEFKPVDADTSTKAEDAATTHSKAGDIV